MIRNQSQCPYCNASVVAYDWQGDKIIFNPDTARQQPCEHLAYVGVYCLTSGQLHARRHTLWLHPSADPSLADYLRCLGNGTASADGAICEFKEAEFEHHHQAGTDVISFFGVFTPDPVEFIRICSEAKQRHWRN